MRTLIVCWRPYQLFNAINLVANNVEGIKGNCDIFLSNTPAMLALEEKVLSTGLFNHVGIYEGLEGKNTITKIRGRLQTALSIFPRLAEKHFTIKAFDNCYKYDLIFATGYAPFFVRMVNINPNARVILFEDGTSHYINAEIGMYQKSKMQRFLKKVFKKGILTVNPEKIYVYRPDMVINNAGSTFCRLPDLSNAGEALAKVFNHVDEIIPANKKFLYLYDDYFFKPVPGLKMHLDETKLNEILLKYSEGMLTRIHPDMETGPAGFEVDTRRYMWEVSANNLTSADTLISVFSTACFTPFMLYGCTPRIVLLHKLNDNPRSYIADGPQKLVERLIEHYPGEVYIPDSFEELDNVLKDLAS